jgi:hypothetical protein
MIAAPTFSVLDLIFQYHSGAGALQRMGENYPTQQMREE